MNSAAKIKMNLDELIKYFLWIAFFAFALFGIYIMLRRAGFLQ